MPTPDSATPPLGPRQAGRHRRLRHEERRRDRRRRHAAGQPHRQRDLRLDGERGMATEHNEPEVVVGDGRTADRLVGAACGRLVDGRQQHEAGSQRGGTPDLVDGAATCGRQQPGLDGVRNPPLRPRLQRQHEGIGGRLLGDVDVTRQPQRPRQHSAPVGALGGGRCGGRIIPAIRRHRTPRSAAARCSRTGPGTARRAGGPARRRRPRSGSSRRPPP